MAAWVKPFAAIVVDVLTPSALIWAGADSMCERMIGTSDAVAEGNVEAVAVAEEAGEAGITLPSVATAAALADDSVLLLLRADGGHSKSSVSMATVPAGKPFRDVGNSGIGPGACSSMVLLL